jgi:hypothetical protein
MTDRDPCHACPQLVVRPNMAPWCQRGAHYGQTGCLRNAQARMDARAPRDPPLTRAQRRSQHG